MVRTCWGGKEPPQTHHRTRKAEKCPLGNDVSLIESELMIQLWSSVVRTLDTSIDRPRLGERERESVKDLNPK